MCKSCHSTVRLFHLVHFGLRPRLLSFADSNSLRLLNHLVGHEDDNMLVKSDSASIQFVDTQTADCCLTELLVKKKTDGSYQSLLSGLGYLIWEFGCGG